jgi:hypothetical protein
MRRFLFLIPIATLFVILERPAYATLSACTGTMNSYTAADNPPNGCGQNDLGFSNFASTGTAASTVNVFASGGIQTGTTLNGDMLEFSSNSYFLTSPATKTFTASNTVQVIGAAGGGVSPSAPYSTYAITALFGGSGLSDFTNTNDSIMSTTYFCLSTLAACTAGTADGELDFTGSANLTETTSYCLYDGMGGCSETGEFTEPLILPEPVYQISFLSTLTVKDAGQSLSSDIEIYFDQTAETPEPATFALAGSALLLLFGRRLRDYRFAIAARPRVLNLLIRQIGKPAHQYECR